jgi:hypothetical protein
MVGNFKAIGHIAKSECPTPKKRMIEEGRKG